MRSFGTTAFIGEIDDSTVLKYPLSPNEFEKLAVLQAEKRMLEILGPHPYIIALKTPVPDNDNDSTNNGIYLERAPHGSLSA